MQWHRAYGLNSAGGVEVIENDGLIHKTRSFMITWCLKDYKASCMHINVVCSIAILPNASDRPCYKVPTPCTLD